MKKIASTLIMLFVILFAINVKAGDVSGIYTTIYKDGDNTGRLYNTMPTEVGKDDTISVKIMIHNVNNWEIESGSSLISWDSALELVETNGKYYVVKNDKITDFSLEIAGENRAHISYYYNGVVDTNDVYVAELKFKFKNNAKDGVYKIEQEYLDRGLTLNEPNTTDYEDIPSFEKTLKYQLGKINVSSKLSKEDIENISGDVYVIGNYMFTRARNSEYDGTLTTEYIMLASKSIDSNNKNDMKIYLKDLFGSWVNAINDNDITPPTDFKINYIDMVPNYSENGIYTDNNEDTMLRLVQISDKEAIVTIETVEERIHGIATINGKVANLSAGGKTYGITITDNGVTITANDDYITKNLTKRCNLTLNDFFNEEYAAGVYDGYGSAVHYLNSEHTGKYTNDRYELDVLRVSQNGARVCLKLKGEPTCIIDKYAYSNEGINHSTGSEETTYALTFGNGEYGIKWTTNKIEFVCLNNSCENNFLSNAYNKDNKKMTIEDALHIWENNEIQYRVIFDQDNGEEPSYLYVPSGKPIIAVDGWEYTYYSHHKEGFVFENWKLGNEVFNPASSITRPITLVANYRPLPGVGVLSTTNPLSETQDYHNFENDVFEYRLSLALDEEYDGFAIYEVNGSDDPVSDPVLKDGYVTVEVPANAIKLYFARAYILDKENVPQYGANSNTIELHPMKYTVTFDSNGGSSIDNQDIPYGASATVPAAIPEKFGFNFIEWQLNGQTYNFDTPVTEPITLVAIWENSIKTPTINEALTNNYYEHKLYLNNQADYCSNLQGTCTVGEEGNYNITGYEIYEVVSGNKVIVEIDNKTQFAPNEYAVINAEPNTVKTYVARAYLKEGALTAYSEYSTGFNIDTTFQTPIIAFNPTYGTPDPTTYEAENWIEVTNLISAYGYECAITPDSCADFKVYQFELYDENLDSLGTFGPTGAVHVSANYGETKQYYVRGYVNYQGQPKYTPYSLPLTYAPTVPNPTINIAHTETGNTEYDNAHYMPFVYSDGDGYLVDFDINTDISNYAFFEKNGNVELTTFPRTGGVSIIIPEGTNKTIVARNYVERAGNQKLYSIDSNEISIDLTNPTYTFETIVSQNDSDKVNIIPYVNNYDIAVHGIIVNDTLYDSKGTGNEVDYVTLDSSILENVDTIVLGIDQPSFVDPNHFAVEVTATRKTN